MGTVQARKRRFGPSAPLLGASKEFVQGPRLRRSSLVGQLPGRCSVPHSLRAFTAYPLARCLHLREAWCGHSHYPPSDASLPSRTAIASTPRVQDERLAVLSTRPPSGCPQGYLAQAVSAYCVDPGLFISPRSPRSCHITRPETALPTSNKSGVQEYGYAPQPSIIAIPPSHVSPPLTAWYGSCILSRCATGQYLGGRDYLQHGQKGGLKAISHTSLDPDCNSVGLILATLPLDRTNMARSP